MYIHIYTYVYVKETFPLSPKTTEASFYFAFFWNKRVLFPAQKESCTRQKNLFLPQTSRISPPKEPDFLEKEPVSPANSARNSLPY